MLTPKKPSCPYFYKYANADHLEWLRDILSSHRVYFPSHPQLNDPQDGWTRLRLLSARDLTSFLTNDFIRRHPGAEPAWLAHEAKVIAVNVTHHGVPAMVAMMEAELKRQMEINRIYSLSMAADSEYMWQKYGGSHTGYCLEFANDGIFSYAREVDYEDNLLPLDVNEPSGWFFYRKTSRWKQEQEARLVMFPRVGERFSAIFGTTDGSFVEFAPHLLSRVLIGRDMTAANRERIASWIKRRKPPVRLEEAKTIEVDSLLR